MFFTRVDYYNGDYEASDGESKLNIYRATLAGEWRCSTNVLRK
jgi:hypothetical protein